MRKTRAKISIKAESPAGERAAARWRARTHEGATRRIGGGPAYPAASSDAGVGRELAATLNRIGGVSSGSYGTGSHSNDPVARLVRELETGRLDLMRTALAGIDSLMARLIPRLNGFGALLRRVLADALKLGARSLLGGLFGGSEGNGRGGNSSGGGILNLFGRGGGGSFGGFGGLFSSPWSALIGGGIVAGWAIWNHFRHGTEKKLREAIRSTYGVDVREMRMLQQIKTLGEEAFGRGQVSGHLLDTIRLEPVKELVQSYAESTGQTARGLLTATQLGDPGWVGNRFIRDAGAGSQGPGAGGSVRGRVSESTFGLRNVGGPATRGPGNNGLVPAMVAAWTGLMARIATQLERWEAVPAEQVVANGAGGAAAAIGNAIITVANDDWRFNDRLSNKRGEKR